MHKIIKIVSDHDCDCPMDWDCQWTLHSFNRNSIHENHEFDGNVPIWLRRKLAVGTAFWLCDNGHEYSVIDKASHGHHGGILIWERDPKELRKSYEDRLKDAETFVESYNDWRNGRCWGYIVENKEGDHLESCFGYFESDAKYLSECAVSCVESGDVVSVTGDGADLFDASVLPATVEMVDFDGDDAA